MCIKSEAQNMCRISHVVLHRKQVLISGSMAFPKPLAARVPLKLKKCVLWHSFWTAMPLSLEHYCLGIIFNYINTIHFNNNNNGGSWGFCLCLLACFVCLWFFVVVVISFLRNCLSESCLYISCVISCINVQWNSSSEMVLNINYSHLRKKFLLRNGKDAQGNVKPSK